ncbi:MAG: addiction module protein [Nitrospirales bacterium]|nr:MAG: addiction module protein [Nitrospirales bacterium]
MSWTLVYTNQAWRDAKKFSRSGLKSQAQKLLGILPKDPYQTPPPYEKLVGDLAGACSRRINIQRRLVYQGLDYIKTIKIIRMWTHYEEDRRITACIADRRLSVPF